MNKRWINTKVEFIWDGSQYVEQSSDGYWYDGEMALCTENFAGPVNITGDNNQLHPSTTGSWVSYYPYIDGVGVGSLLFGSDTSAWLENRQTNGKLYLNAGSSMPSVPSMTLDGSKVGIGTNSPVSPLQVGTATGSDPTTTANIMSISANRAFTSGYSGQLFVQPSDYGQDYGGMITFGIHRASGLASPLPACAIAGRKEEGTSGNYSAYLHFGTRANGGNITEKMRITSAGNVGIGTTAPNASLHIGSASAVGTETNPAFQIGSTGNYRFGVYTTGEGATVENKNGDDGVRFVVKTAGEAMRVTGGTGYVGIGTVSPSSALDIVNTTEPQVQVSNGVNSKVQIRSSANASAINFHKQQSGGTQVNIGMNVAGSAGLVDDLVFSLNNGTTWYERMRILNNGNVGIGDTTPSYKLEIAGTFYASGSSANFKKNVTDLAVDSSAIYNLNPVSYNYKKDYENFGYDLAEGKQFGLISEEVAEAVPELAIMKDGEPKNVDYQKLSVLLLAEMQKMNKRIEDLECHI